MATRIPRFRGLATPDDNRKLERRSDAIAFPAKPKTRPVADLYGLNLPKHVKHIRLSIPEEVAVKAHHNARVKTAIGTSRSKRSKIAVTLPTIKGLSDE